MEQVGWARRVNSRWIVHHGLKESAEAYLTHLQSDSERLAHSCERARRLVNECEPGEDPKPWFYAGLFSLATVEEAKQFLSGHRFTAACIPSLPPTLGALDSPDHVAAETQEKIARIRRALACRGQGH